MSFWWGGSNAKDDDAKDAGEEHKGLEEEARKLLTATYTKHDELKLSEIPRILELYKGNEQNLIKEVTEKYGEIERVKNVREKLVEQYTQHCPEKLNVVDELLSRFPGKEEELLQEVVKKYEKKDAALLPALACAEVEPTINTSLPLIIQEKKFYYSGYLWEHTGGWLASRQKKWCILICQHFYIGTEPTDDAYDIIPLKGATVVDAPDLEDGGYVFNLTHPTKGSFLLYSENEAEKLMWAVRIEAAILQANPDRVADKEARDMYTKVFSNYPERPCVPYYKNMLKTMLDHVKNSNLSRMKPLGAGYLITKTGDSWLGSNWGRRYVVLYEFWYTIRPDKSSAAGLLLVPLADTDIIFEESEAAFTIESDFSPNVSFQPDSKETLEHWLHLFKLASTIANPDKEPLTPLSKPEHSEALPTI
eukprot:TRINITY_DN2753_c0_g1_i1.p1 TRINITY_DN2753_c0_g1~~TRINITY_DN2753_c0_g1_i1.p1  ORF type:complete len:420 (+),score=74.14 TRINITY_DN2753_c0_g1_i1:62-1321(+)